MVGPGLDRISPDYQSGKISHITRGFPSFPPNVGDGYLNMICNTNFVGRDMQSLS